MRSMTGEEKARAWQIAAGYLDYVSEWNPDDGTSEESIRSIMDHVHRVIQPSLIRQSQRILDRLEKK
jgi:hypothetical protein